MLATVNFTANFAVILKEILSQFEVPVPPSATPEELLLGFFTWQHRRIQAQPRRIEVAKDFSCPAHLVAGYQRLRDAIECGEDLTPWLSSRSQQFLCPDELLGEWDIQHFHLGLPAPGQQRVGRTGELVFALIATDTVYFIGVRDHVWTDMSLLTTMHSNWPSLTEKFTIKGMAGTQRGAVPLTPSETKALRKARIGTFFPMPDGKVLYPPGGGILGRAGLSFKVRFHVDSLLRELSVCENWAVNEVRIVATSREITGPFHVYLKRGKEDGGLYVTCTELNVGFKIPLQNMPVLSNFCGFAGSLTVNKSTSVRIAP